MPMPFNQNSKSEWDNHQANAHFTDHMSFLYQCSIAQFEQRWASKQNLKINIMVFFEIVQDQNIAKLSPNFSFSWAELDFILNLPHPPTRDQRDSWSRPFSGLGRENTHFSGLSLEYSWIRVSVLLVETVPAQSRSNITKIILLDSLFQDVTAALGNPNSKLSNTTKIAWFTSQGVYRRAYVCIS